MDSNYTLTLQEIVKNFPKTINRFRNGLISILADSEENRQKIINYLKENEKEFILSERLEERPHKIVIKNLPVNIDMEIIKQELEAKNFEIKRICQLKNYKLKSFHPLFLIDIHKTKNYLNIYNVKDITNLRVKIETFRKRTKAIISALNVLDTITAPRIATANPAA